MKDETHKMKHKQSFKSESKLLANIVREAGAILLKYFGKVRHIRHKGEPSSVVCEADLAAEKYVIDQLRAHFPEDSIISEEAGFLAGNSGRTWVIDPLDGTSNFVAGIPWFGVQVGLLAKAKPVLAAMYLPVNDILYLAESGQGTLRNGRRVQSSPERNLRNVLCAFGFDPSAVAEEKRRFSALLMHVAGNVRNTRATNSLVDFCYTVDGKFGGCINLNCKIWDIVPFALILPEAGGKLTDLKGKPLDFRSGEQQLEKTYAILGASRPLYPKLLRLTDPWPSV
jgi:myo-inositol-1(or 4)-monophosphatase